MSRRLTAIAGSALFLVLAPGTVAGLIPYLLSHWQVAHPPTAARLLGILLISLGSIGLLDSFRRFAIEGLGTPAPVYPTRQLIITGLYRYARNPMYTAVVSTILGQALLLGNPTVMGYGFGIWALFHAFVLGYEEPKLRAMFGPDYQAYQAAVPRWIPRLTPWRGKMEAHPL